MKSDVGASTETKPVDGAPTRNAPDFADPPGAVRKSESPLAQGAFDGLAGAWRPLGVWLTVWDAVGRECLYCDDIAPRFWLHCWKHGNGFRDAIRDAIRPILTGNHGAGDKPFVITALPSLPGACIGAIPIRRRRKLLGVCVAALVGAGDVDEEALLRFCSQQGLDAATAQASLAALATRSADDQYHLVAGIAEHVRQAQDNLDQSIEIESLSRNLDSTYEELSLVFRISRSASLSEEPVEMLGRVAGETLGASRTAGIAFLSPVISSPTVAVVGRSTAEVPAESRFSLVTSGFGMLRNVPAAEIEAAAARMHAVANSSEVGIFNRAHLDARLGPPRDWLRHALFIPMRHKERDLGTLLAVNVIDEGDFTSIEVQLLRAVADRVAAFLDNQRLYDNLADLFMGMLHALIHSIDAKDPYTCGHSERVAFLSRCIAEAAKLGPHEVQRVYLAGLLHDVGKIGIADAILCKPGKLTDEEFDILRKHPEIGARILSTVPQVADLIPGVLYHHERMDGRGYPARLRGCDIPLMARVICLADCLDAMTTTRTYRSFLPPPLAIAEVRRCSGTQFDPALGEILLSMNVGELLAEAHEFAGSQLPGMGESAVVPSDPGMVSFAHRPIFTREMFHAQVKSW